MADKRGILVFVFILIVISITVGELNPVFGQANASVGVQNDPPNVTFISNQSLAQNSSLSLDLSQFFTDPEKVTLNFTTTSPQNITIVITAFNSTIGIIPDPGFIGNRTINFTAFDFVNFVTSNTFTIIVNSSIVVAPTPTGQPGPGGAGGGGGVSFPPAEEEEVIFAAPVLEPLLALEECKVEQLYVDDELVSNFATFRELHLCSVLYFAPSWQTENLAYIVIFNVNRNEGELTISYVNEAGDIQELVLNSNDQIRLDIDNNGLVDYVVTFDEFDSLRTVTLTVQKNPKSTLTIGEKLGLGPLVFSLIFLLILLIIIAILLYYLRRKVIV